MKIRIATFNCENLFARFKFKSNYNPNQASTNGFDINNLTFKFHDEDKRRITANAINGVKADVIALQEVENLDVLERFRNQFLGGFKAYPYLMLIDANDPRYIDVAVLSKHPIIHARSYQHLKKSASAKSFIFSRDCLEVDIDFKGKVVTLFVNHFKSMMGGRPETKQRRLEQVNAVKKLIRERFGNTNTGSKPFIVLGDFNDYIETGLSSQSAISELVNWSEVENVVDQLPAQERWTHFYKAKKEYRQLDYILVSKTLINKVNAVEIERRGMPKRAVKYSGPRFVGVGQDNPKASDHCPVVVELNF